MASTQILFLSDTHLGFDDPVRPIIQRRRRGPDFFEHYMKALEPALEGKVDCVVHGGDLFYRSRIPDSLISRAFAPLLEIADSGIPILIVPGNHERSRIHQGLLETHSGIRIFHEPDTFLLKFGDIHIAFSGLPFYRGDARGTFEKRLEETNWRNIEAHLRFLCLHHAVSGAQVGVQNYTFRTGSDTIDAHQIPGEFNAVLCGHIHRHQFLNMDHTGHDLQVPVLFAGATTRTTFDERREVKGYCMLTCSRADGVSQWSYEFVDLPSRPMIVLSETDPLQFGGAARSRAELQEILMQKLSALDSDAVVKIRFNPPPGELPALSVTEIRRLAPETMSIEVSGFRKPRT